MRLAQGGGFYTTSETQQTTPKGRDRIFLSQRLRKKVFALTNNSFAQ
jgi:hypothetical protein